ncbi:MAG: dihydroneopterin aldolase [Gemmatimonadota bacterium]|nr:dihydroneopterin aldolase [Gemmatimonadota bacterium]
MDAIRLLGMTFHTIVGDLPHEREIPQPIEVDVEVATDVRPAARSDDLEDGLDYRRIYQAVAGIASGAPATAPRLIETLAERIASKVLSFDRVEGVTVRVRKPRAALDGPVEGIEVEVERS